MEILCYWSGYAAGKIVAENNTLYADDAKVRQDTKWLLPHLEGEKKQQAEKLIANLNTKDLAFDEAIDKACQNLSSEQCRGMRQTLSEMGKSYDKNLDGEYIATMRAVYKDDAGKADGQMWKYATAYAKAQRVADIQKLATIHEISPQMAEILYDTMAGIHTTAAIGGTIYGLKGAGVPATASKSTTSLVDAEKAALERIAQNAKNTKDLGTKEPNSIYNQQLVKDAEKSVYYSTPTQGGILKIGAEKKPIEGAYNIPHPDYPKSAGVYSGDANNLSNVATDSQKTIIMENPYGFKPFNGEILRVLGKNGTMVVTGTWNNKTLNNIEKAAESKAFVLIAKNIKSSKGFLQSDGNPINNPTVTEYQFRRK